MKSWLPRGYRLALRMFGEACRGTSFNRPHKVFMLRGSKQETWMRNVADCLSAFSHGVRTANPLVEASVARATAKVKCCSLSSGTWSTKIGLVSEENTTLPRPTSVFVVAALVMLEALAVLAYAVSYLVSIGTSTMVNMGGQLFMLALCLLAAIWQGSVSINFFKGKAFTRAPIVVWQLFQLILSVSFLSSNIALVKAGAVVSILVAGATVVLLFAPKTTAFLGDRPSR